MMRIGKLCFLMIVIVWSPVACASGFSDLESWVGGYPVRDANGKSEKILDNQHLKSSLRSLLAASDVKKLNDYSQSSKIEDIDGYIVINKCKPRNCAPERLIIVLDKTNDRLWAGFFERQPSRVIVKWYGNVDDYYLLPNRILEEFRETH